MLASPTTFQPTIEDFREFLKNEAHEYDMRTGVYDQCPIFWYLQKRGLPVHGVGIPRISIYFDSSATWYDKVNENVHKLSNEFWKFGKVVDNRGPNLRISAQECLDILDNLDKLDNQ